MLYLPLLGLVTVASFAAWRVAKATVIFKKPPDPTRTIIDTENAEDAVRLVAHLSTAVTTSGALADRLIAIYRRFPPRERSMQSMSFEQQKLHGTGGPTDYAVCTVYSAQLEAAQMSDGLYSEAPIARRWSEGLNAAVAPNLRISPGSKSTAENV